MTYLAYAGIGSRSTPQHIMKIMHYLGAYLEFTGWTLRSGGAEGADSAFEQGAVDQALTVSGLPRREIYLPWAGFNNNPSTLHPQAIPFSDEEIAISAGHHPAWHKCSPAAKRMHQRNLRQMIGHESVCGPVVQPSKFVVCWTEGGQMKGGTSQALRIAKALNIPIVNLGSISLLGSPEQHLEALVLEVDRLQAKFKAEALTATQTAPEAA